MGPEIIIPLSGMATAVICVIRIPLVRGYTRRMEAEAKNPRVPPEVMTRLERIEQAVDAVAIEVERISEGQRFTTKLLSEGRGGEVPQISPSAAAQNRTT